MQADSDHGCGPAWIGLLPANRWSVGHFVSIFFDHFAFVHCSPAATMPWSDPS
jgi:hypothetical protein